MSSFCRLVQYKMVIGPACNRCVPTRNNSRFHQLVLRRMYIALSTTTLIWRFYTVKLAVLNRVNPSPLLWARKFFFSSQLTVHFIFFSRSIFPRFALPRAVRICIVFYHTINGRRKITFENTDFLKE